MLNEIISAAQQLTLASEVLVKLYNCSGSLCNYGEYEH